MPVTHMPAGSPAGGQFAPASGGGGGQDSRPTPGDKNAVGFGESSDRVKQLQARLDALGMKLKVDGKFGPKTLAAVRAFQKSHGLKVDGLVGPKTTAALRIPKGKAAKKAAGHAEVLANQLIAKSAKAEGV